MTEGKPACCIPGRGSPADAHAVSPGEPPATGAASGVMLKTPESRIAFAAGRSFVGTDEPEIPADGEGPKRRVTLAAFALETVTVTNERFGEFVAATGYRTEAEILGWSAVFSGLLPDGHRDRYRKSDSTPWWASVEGACWSRPEGPGSDIADRADHPVIQISWRDAHAFAAWVGGRLPTEVEWEHAARGGTDERRFPWGNEEPDDNTVHCNIWQGEFPGRNICTDGYYGTAPAQSFEPNPAGLYNMAGNVWEWTADAFRVRSLSRQAKLRTEQAAAQGQKVLKGGSFLCHISYCYRYRIAARTAAPADSGASNVGFRVAFDTR